MVKRGGKSIVYIRLGVLHICNPLLGSIKRDEEFLGTCIDFPEGKVTNRLDGIYTITGLRGMLEGKDYRSLETVFPFVAASINRSTKCETTPSMTIAYTCFSEIAIDVIEDMAWRTWREDNLSCHESMVRGLRKRFLDAFD